MMLLILAQALVPPQENIHLNAPLLQSKQCLD